MFAIGGSSENAAAAELVAGTSIFNGTAQESFIAQTPENTVTLTLSGTGPAFRQRIWVGTGGIAISNNIKVVTGYIASTPGSGTFSILNGAAVAVPYQGFASSVLVDFAGAAETREIAVYQGYITSGSLTFAGALAHPLIDYTPAPTGSGLFTVSGSSEIEVWTREIGSGSVTITGGSDVKFISQAGEGTILYDLKGASAETALNQVYGYYGDDKDPGTSGLVTISGIGGTKKIAVYQGYVTTGGFTFSNTPLVHPFVDYTPSIGIGKAVLYNISGAGSERRAWAPVYGSGSFKKLASLDEAFARTTYIGAGTVNFFGAAPTEILVFEEGRTYVVII